MGRCIYEGIFVGEGSEIPNTNGMRNDVVSALRELKIPVLRWPGGCFADEYHWKDGVGAKENRKKMINTHWGGMVEDNSFGTHEFFELCRQLECEPYVNGNMGSGTVQEMSEWIEYITFDGVSPMAKWREENSAKSPWRLKYFGVGNENWGCGGNMQPEYYANEYRRYQTYCRSYGDNKLFKIACGPNSDDYAWTEQVMKTAANYMDGLSLHYYTVPGEWKNKGSATKFSREEYYSTLKKTFKMEELVENHSKIMDKYDPQKRVGLMVDEWGTWYDVEPATNPGFLYQQNTVRDALVAAINLNIFQKHSDRVKMANIAQVVNVLQAMVLTEGSKMVLTPTYHVFNMMKSHQEAVLLDSFIETEKICEAGNEIPNLHESASISKDGTINITIANLSDSKSYSVDTELVGAETAILLNAQILTGNIDSFNSFENPNQVSPNSFDSVMVQKNLVSFEIPPCSVLQLAIKQ